MLDPMQLLPCSFLTLQDWQMDTALPRSIVPVYFVHSVDAPFCEVDTCECHLFKLQVIRLLAAIHDGKASLARASYFTDEK